jgi:hypothetical protein
MSASAKPHVCDRLSRQRRHHLWANAPATIACEDVPLAEARRMSRGPRMDPELYRVLKAKIQSLDSAATRLTIPEGTSTTPMKHRILRVASELKTPVTTRRVSRGLFFWRVINEAITPATATASRLRGGPPRRRSRSGPGGVHNEGDRYAIPSRP